MRTERQVIRYVNFGKCTELKKKSNCTQNDLKTVDVQPPISRAIDGLNKEIEEIDLEPAKRNLQSNFCNGNTTEINIEEQRSDSNPNPSKPMDLSPFRQNFEKNRNRQKYHHSLNEHPTFTKIAKFGCEML